MYVSIDIETTGLDPVKDQMLEIAAVMWTSDTINDCEVFRACINPAGGQPDDGAYGNDIHGGAYALNMNSDLISEIANGMGQNIRNVMHDFERWLLPFTYQGAITPIGQNFGKFDWQFLINAPGFDESPFGHRFVDITSFMATRQGIKSAKNEFIRLAEYHCIEGSTHEALYDAKCTLAFAMEHIK